MCNSQTDRFNVSWRTYRHWPVPRFTDVLSHYNDVIMGAIASQITNLTSVYSMVTSKLRVTGLCARNSPVNFPHKWPVTRKIISFDDVIMNAVYYLLFIWSKHQEAHMVSFHGHCMRSYWFWIYLNLSVFMFLLRFYFSNNKITNIMRGMVLSIVSPPRAGPGPLFTKRTDVLPQDLVKSRSREIGWYNDRIVLKFDRHLDSTACYVFIKCQSDWISLNPNLVASRLHEILR